MAQPLFAGSKLSALGARDPRSEALAAAVRRTLAYAGIFSYPLTVAELQRYLHGERASIRELRLLVEDGLDGVAGHDGFHTLGGNLAHVAERRRRQMASAPLLARARLYAALLAHLPFVRMVGLTGSLAMRNLSTDGPRDIDLLVVTAPGRVWLGRAGAIAVVYLARLAGDVLCPNFVVSEHALALADDSIYSAHELAQMLPLHGRSVYRQLWDRNRRLLAQLPNAAPRPLPPDRLVPGGAAWKRLTEWCLGGVLGDALEAWERRRKTRRLRRREDILPMGGAEPEAARSEASKARGGALWVRSPEVVLDQQQCKGHFSHHRVRVLAAYEQRLAELEGQ